VGFESVLAPNVLTKIAYGMFNDGCTALSWREVAGKREVAGVELGCMAPPYQNQDVQDAWALVS
jgi:hypothetical protein